MAPRRFELVAAGHSKFWEIAVAARKLTVRFGRIGSAGVAKTKTFGSPRDATEAAAKLVREKTAKGYVEGKARAPREETVFERLSALWAVKRPTLELRKGATPAQLASFQRKLGLPLPDTFRTLYAWHDGAKDENDWFEGAYGWFRLSYMLSHKKMVDDVRGDDGTWNRAWVPFLQENYSDLVCFDSKTGEVFEWFNSGGVKRNMLAPSLDAWLASHVALTEAAKSLDDDDGVYDAFTGPAAKRIRAKIARRR
jgi:predicted DNA-binding WGR domain protein